jgi:hypothetical protein
VIALAMDLSPQADFQQGALLLNDTITKPIISSET